MKQILRRWQRAVVYITGGSSGIGYACAAQLCGIAQTIVLLARRKPLLNEAAQRLQLLSQKGAALTTIASYALDVSNSHCRKVLQQVVRNHGAPTLLINSAGCVAPGYFHEISEAMLTAMWQTNVGGIWHTLQVLLPLMAQSTEQAQIINVASFAGLLGVFGYSAYSASKYAVIGLSEALRNEYAGKVAISVLCPSDTDTPQLAEENRLKPPETAAVAGTIRPMRPQYVAQYALRLAARGKFLIIPGSYPSLVWAIKRWAPRLLYRVIDSKVGAHLPLQ